MCAISELRPEGLAGNRPGRQAGVGNRTQLSAEGAILEALNDAPSALDLSFQSYPGLPAGPISCQPFGPQQQCASICEALYILTIGDILNLDPKGAGICPGFKDWILTKVKDRRAAHVQVWLIQYY